MLTQPGFFFGGPMRGPPSSFGESSSHDRRRLSSAPFGGSYSFPEVYTTAYARNTVKQGKEYSPPTWSLYRWHTMDPVSFSHKLHVNVQTLGWWSNSRHQPPADDITSVAY